MRTGNAEPHPEPEAAKAVLLGIVAICILASAYLERWVFDEDSGLMERNVGLLFWHSSARTPLSDLAQVTLRQPAVA